MKNLTRTMQIIAICASAVVSALSAMTFGTGPVEGMAIGAIGSVAASAASGYIA